MHALSNVTLRYCRSDKVSFLPMMDVRQTKRSEVRSTQNVLKLCFHLFNRPLEGGIRSMSQGKKARQEFKIPLWLAVRKRITFLVHNIDSLWFNNTRGYIDFYVAGCFKKLLSPKHTTLSLQFVTQHVSRRIIIIVFKANSVF